MSKYFKSLRPLSPTWVVIGCAILLRLPSLARTMYLDELATLSVISEPTYRAAMAILRTDTHHPGYFTLLWLWGRISLATPWLRTMSLIFDTASLLVLRQSLRRISTQASFVGVAIWSVCPLALRNATEIRPYAALAFCSLIALISSLQLVQNKADKFSYRDTLAASASWMLVVLMHPVGFMVVVANWLSLLLLGLVKNTDGEQNIRHTMKKAASAAYALAIPLGLATGLFGWVHYYFALDPTAGERISWMPAMSLELASRIFNSIYGVEDVALAQPQSAFANVNFYLGLTIFFVFVCLGYTHKVGRIWANAALIYAAIVIGFSIEVRPIFWHRSILPSIAFATYAMACGSLRLGRPLLAALFLPLMTWQVAAWIPRAQRAIDPCEDAAIALVKILRKGDAVAVSPAFMNIAIEPQLALDKTTKIVSFEDVTHFTKAQNIACLVRGDMTENRYGKSVTDLLHDMRQGGAIAHDWFLFLDENDDLSAPSQAKRRDVIAIIDNVFGPCLGKDSIERVAHLRCENSR